jgi:hypothetical protein
MKRNLDVQKEACRQWLYEAIFTNAALAEVHWFRNNTTSTCEKWTSWQMKNNEVLTWKICVKTTVFHSGCVATCIWELDKTGPAAMTDRLPVKSYVLRTDWRINCSTKIHYIHYVHILVAPTIPGRSFMHAQHSNCILNTQTSTQMYWNFTINVLMWTQVWHISYQNGLIQRGANFQLLFNFTSK